MVYNCVYYCMLYVYIHTLIDSTSPCSIACIKYIGVVSVYMVYNCV
jgi:hypothetical protein